MPISAEQISELKCLSAYNLAITWLPKLFHETAKLWDYVGVFIQKCSKIILSILFTGSAAPHNNWSPTVNADK